MKRIRLLAAFVLAAMLLFCASAVHAAEAETPADEFRYERVRSGLVITKYTGSSVEVVVPEIINGVRVQSIGAEAFAWNPRIEHVVLPYSVQFISLRAFIGCENLRKVDWPDELQGIGLEAFMDCVSLESVRLPPSALYISQSAFAGCTALEEVVLPEGLYDVAPMCFRDCTGLQSAVILGAATTGTAFAEDAPFAGCTSLEQFAYGGSQEDLNELLPPEMQQEIPVFLVNCSAAGGSLSVRGCRAPAGELVLPVEFGGMRLAAFNDHAFAEDGGTGRVFYLGTQAEWERIDLGEGNAPLAADNVVCLGRNPDAEPLAPCWDAEKQIVTGVSVADLAGMPLRGLDLMYADWVPSQSAEPDRPQPDPDDPAAFPPLPGDPGGGNPEDPVPEPDEPQQPADPSAEPSAAGQPEGSEPEPLWTYAFFSSDGDRLSRYDILGTGCLAVRTGRGSGQQEEAQIALSGDVTGSGIMNVTQLVRMAKGLSGVQPLAGAYLAAADLNGSGALDVADLTMEAAWLIQFGLPASHS